MKRKLPALLCLLLAAALSCAALAEAGYAGATYYDEYYEHDASGSAGRVHVSGDTDIHSAPDADASVMERAYGGSDYEYMNQTQYDGDGTAWYCVYCYGYLGWISAAHSELQGAAF